MRARRSWKWAIGLGVLLLVAAALTFPLVATANDDVGFCLSCHVMEGQGKSHATSFHRNEATCSECHTGSLPQKYADGARHLTHQVLGSIPDPIKLRDASREVVAGQCAQCHAETSLHARTKRDKQESCLECHKGHDPRPVVLPGQ